MLIALAEHYKGSTCSHGGMSVNSCQSFDNWCVAPNPSLSFGFLISMIGSDGGLFAPSVSIRWFASWTSYTLFFGRRCPSITSTSNRSFNTSQPYADKSHQFPQYRTASPAIRVRRGQVKCRSPVVVCWGIYLRQRLFSCWVPWKERHRFGCLSPIPLWLFQRSDKVWKVFSLWKSIRYGGLQDLRVCLTVSFLSIIDVGLTLSLTPLLAYPIVAILLKQNEMRFKCQCCFFLTYSKNPPNPQELWGPYSARSSSRSVAVKKLLMLWTARSWWVLQNFLIRRNNWLTAQRSWWPRYQYDFTGSTNFVKFLYFFLYTLFLIFVYSLTQ